MSIEPISIGIIILGFGLITIPLFDKIDQEERERKEKEKIKRDEHWKAKILLYEVRSKKYRKQNYINELIDEIPDLSYYEAKQLQKKLGNIYIEWDDE